MTAAEVKDALRCRHEALREFGGPGAWTCLEEFAGVDLLAFAAWRSIRRSIVGYEVKVTRADYRREILEPGKRALAVAGCHAFYFATPAGLLTAEEKEFREPDSFYEPGAFEREACPERCQKMRKRHRRYSLYGVHVRDPADLRKAGRIVEVPTVYGEEATSLSVYVEGEHKVFDPSRETDIGSPPGSGRGLRQWVVCATCDGRGYTAASHAEQVAPTLWVPRDVGLVEVDGAGTHVVREAPSRTPSREIGTVGELVRWASFRPDPRHHS